MAEEFIVELYELGLTYKQIKQTLDETLNTHYCERQIRRILKRRGLSRRSGYSDVNVVIDFMLNEVQNSGLLHGYRWMYRKCLASGIKVKRDLVYLILKIIDPIGVAIRKARRLNRRVYYSEGPNYIWHVDSYDKLKPFGICINGCIDGFSRKIIWLNAFTTSSDPKVIAGYYIEAVRQYEIWPKILRSDRGTENNIMIQFQQFCNENGFRTYGIQASSTQNQRIESWWGILRKECAEFWMALFHDLKNAGLFSGSQLDKNLVQFCFMELIQGELKRLVLVWDTHHLRRTKDANSPHGIPNVMFYTPNVYGKTDHGVRVPPHIVDVCSEEVTFRGNIICENTDVFEACTLLKEELNMGQPTNVDGALHMYIRMRRYLQR